MASKHLEPQVSSSVMVYTRRIYSTAVSLIQHQVYSSNIKKQIKLKKMVMNIFYSIVMIKIGLQKEMYVLHELRKNVATINGLHELTEPTIKHK